LVAAVSFWVFNRFPPFIGRQLSARVSLRHFRLKKIPAAGFEDLK
jgi:hypothetical protein